MTDFYAYIQKKETLFKDVLYVFNGRDADNLLQPSKISTTVSKKVSKFKVRRPVLLSVDT